MRVGSARRGWSASPRGCDPVPHGIRPFPAVLILPTEFPMTGYVERPSKICPVCGRPFQWRKKWKDVWEEVRYCSERCRRRRQTIPVDPVELQ